MVFIPKYDQVSLNFVSEMDLLSEARRATEHAKEFTNKEAQFIATVARRRMNHQSLLAYKARQKQTEQMINFLIQYTNMLKERVAHIQAMPRYRVRIENMCTPFVTRHRLHVELLSFEGTHTRMVSMYGKKYMKDIDPQFVRDMCYTNHIHLTDEQLEHIITGGVLVVGGDEQSVALTC